jgi:hypothetical protein
MGIICLSSTPTRNIKSEKLGDLAGQELFSFLGMAWLGNDVSWVSDRIRSRHFVGTLELSLTYGNCFNSCAFVQLWEQCFPSESVQFKEATLLIKRRWIHPRLHELGIYDNNLVGWLNRFPASPVLLGPCWRWKFKFFCNVRPTFVFYVCRLLDVCIV